MSYMPGKGLLTFIGIGSRKRYALDTQLLGMQVLVKRLLMLVSALTKKDTAQNYCE